MDLVNLKNAEGAYAVLLLSEISNMTLDDLYNEMDELEKEEVCTIPRSNMMHSTFDRVCKEELSKRKGMAFIITYIASLYLSPDTPLRFDRMVANVIYDTLTSCYEHHRLRNATLFSMILERISPSDVVQTLRRHIFVQMNVCELENTISNESDSRILNRYNTSLAILKEYQ